MATKHRRVNVSFKPEIAQALVRLSKKNETSLSHTTQELVEEALELREDIYLSKLAEEAEKRARGKPSISADKLWKNLHLK
ncbi:MAG: antitoxin, RHH family protein [Chlamydiae bacterium]|nr:antitoxin, RHH family protein [Chlamydiota bacterium]